MSDRRLDLRGLRCPWPALRVARALREGAGALVAVADDPLAPGEIGAVAAARGWTATPCATAIGEGLLLAPDDAKCAGSASPAKGSS